MLLLAACQATATANMGDTPEQTRARLNPDIKVLEKYENGVRYVLFWKQDGLNVTVRFSGGIAVDEMFAKTTELTEDEAREILNKEEPDGWKPVETQEKEAVQFIDGSGHIAVYYNAAHKGPTHHVLQILYGPTHQGGVFK